MELLGTEKTMTVKEVAEVLGVDERTVQRHAKAIMNSDNVVAVEHGKQTLLSEAVVTQIKMKIERSGRNDLDNVTRLPKTQLEKQLLIQQAMILQAEMIKDLSIEVIELKAENEVMKPKVATHDALIRAKEEMSISEAFEYFGVQPKKIGFPYLRKQNYLNQEGLPTSKAIQGGFMKQRLNRCPDGAFRGQAVVESGMLIRWSNALIPNIKKYSIENFGGKI